MNNSSQRLQQLCLIRAIVIAAQLVGLMVAWFSNLYDLSFVPLAIILALMSLINLGCWWRCQQSWLLSHEEFLGHLTSDVLAFAALLYFSGGASNPFVSYFLVPISIAAATLPGRHTAAIAGLAIACYTLLMEYHINLSVLAPSGYTEHAAHMNHSQHPASGNASAPNLHILGMCLILWSAPCSSPSLWCAWPALCANISKPCKKTVKCSCATNNCLVSPL